MRKGGETFQVFLRMIVLFFISGIHIFRRKA